MGFTCRRNGLDIAVHKVSTSTSMDMDVDPTRGDISPVCLEHLDLLRNPFGDLANAAQTALAPLNISILKQPIWQDSGQANQSITLGVVGSMWE
jgi:hypothetical protein